MNLRQYNSTKMKSATSFWCYLFNYQQTQYKTRSEQMLTGEGTGLPIQGPSDQNH